MWITSALPSRVLAPLFAVIVLVLLATSADNAHAASFVVNLASDESDASAADGVCDTDTTTIGLQCTLRAAIQQANATGASDQVAFAVGSGLATIIPNGPLPTITNPLVIDGTTQPPGGPGPRLVIDGSAAGAGAAGITVASPGVTVRGLVIHSFGGAGIEVLESGRATIAGNQIGTGPGGANSMPNGVGVLLRSASNVVGGLTPADRNVISGNSAHGVNIAGAGAQSNLVRGNYIGVDASGTFAVGNGQHGVFVSRGSGNVIGGPEPGARNVISGNAKHGVQLFAEVFGGGRRNVVQGNYAGTNAAGNGAIPNGDSGIHVYASENTIGGPGEGEGNLVSGNGAHGIQVGGLAPQVIDSFDNVVQGNLVGTDASGVNTIGNANFGIFLNGIDNLTQRTQVGGEGPGEGNVIGGSGSHGISVAGAGADDNVISGNSIGATPGGAPLPNGGAGVYIAGSTLTGTVVGGSTAGGNLIAHNAAPGVVVSQGSRNLISHNSIFANGSPGIDLGYDGVTPNDPGDADEGPNGLQNYPVLQSIQGAIVSGELLSRASSTFTLHFYLSQVCSVGAREAQQYVDTETVSTDNLGAADFALPVSGLVAGRYLTATATDAENNTSELSTCLLVPALPASPTPSPSPTATPTPTDTPVPTETPTPTPTLGKTTSPRTQGDVDCDGDVDPVDALGVLVYAAGLTPVEQNEPCPEVGSFTSTRLAPAGPVPTLTPAPAETLPPAPTIEPTATPAASESPPVKTPSATPAATPTPAAPTLTATPSAAPRLFGDVDCDGDIDTVDALAILRFAAGLEALGQVEPCPDVGGKARR